LKTNFSGGTGGFALILVVWLLVLIGSIGAYLVANGRAETAIAFNMRAAASAEALADAGIARAVFNQTDPRNTSRWKLDGEAHRIALPAGTIEIRLEDETQKINPNLASETLLAALFEVCGTERGKARHLGAAVADWVSADGAPREGGAKLDQYRAAGRSYGPPNAPAESLDELQLVLGMTPDILASVRPYLTIYTSAPAPDGKAAPLLVQRALVLAARAQDDDAEAPKPAAPAPATQQPVAEERVIAAEVTGHSREGGVFVRYAVLRLEPDGAKSYSVLDWRRGAAPDLAQN
jgi:general secretion pathway protein K